MKNSILPLLSSLAIAGCYVDGAPPVDGDADAMDDAGDDAEPGPLDGRRITGVPIAPGGLSYQGVDGGEQGPSGPTAYLVDDRGLNWIADGLGNQILVVDDDGAIVERYALGGLIQRLADIEVTATHVYVLDDGLARPKIARAGRSELAATLGADAAWESFDVPASLGDPAQITGLRRDSDGAVLFELGLGARVRAVFAADGGYLGDGQAEATSKHRAGAHEVELIGVGVDVAGAGQDPSATGALLVDGAVVHEFHPAGTLAGLGFIAAGQDGEFWVRVQDMYQTAGEIHVRDFAYRFDAGGQVLEMFEMPVAGEAVYVHQRVAFDLEGNVRALRTADDEVVLMEPQQIELAVAVRLPPGAMHPGTVHGVPSGPRSQCVTGQEILSRAWSYADYEATYSPSQLSAQNSCANRDVPDSVPAGVAVKGVIYSYAGYEDLDHYANAAAQGLPMGDIHAGNGSVAGCAHGVDCSGFVSKAWGAPHHTTHNMHEISSEIPVWGLIPGDALNRAGSHIRLFEGFADNGANVVESTTGNFDRVIGRPLSWAAFEGYKPIRYVSHCGYYSGDEPPPPPPDDGTTGGGDGGTTDGGDDTTGGDGGTTGGDPMPSPDGKEWHFRNSQDPGPGEWIQQYGWDTDLAVVGDWNGDGIDTAAVFRDGNWYLTNSFDTSEGETVFAYGWPGDIPVAGDWNGDGVDTIGVYRPSTLSFYQRNSNSGGPEDIIFQYGVPGNVPVTGDWNGDGIDTVGVFLDGHWMLRDSNSSGNPDYDFNYGLAGTVPVVGDWDANGTDTIGVVDTTSEPPWLTWMLHNSNAEGWFEIEFTYGEPGDRPLAGDWNGDGVDTMVITR